MGPSRAGAGGAGWGPAQAFPAVAPDGRELVLKVRLPLDWRRADLAAVADQAPPNASVAAARQRLAAAGNVAGVIAVLGIGHTVKRDAGPDVHLVASLTVALRDVEGAMPDRLPDATVDPIQVNAVGGRYDGVRVRKQARADVSPDGVGVPMYLIQYLLRTPYGVMSSTYATPQRDLYDGRMVPLFDELVTGLWLEPGGSATCTSSSAPPDTR